MNMSRSLDEHLPVCGDDLLTLHDQSDGLHAGVGEDIVAGKLGQALDAFKENVQDIRLVLGEDLAHSLEGQLHDVLVHVRCVEVEHQIKMISQNFPNSTPPLQPNSAHIEIGNLTSFVRQNILNIN